MQSIEAINGSIWARGDMQFRLYVLLKPEAMDKLKASGEFFRDRDNTVYHRGYPLNYRQGGGVPSIQISMAKDLAGTRISMLTTVPPAFLQRSSIGHLETQIPTCAPAKIPRFT